MSKVHVLTGPGSTYQLYIHTNMPAGVNAVGNSWQACYIAAHSPTSQMSVGTGIGQISSSEAASIVAGQVIEIPVTLTVDANGATPSSTAIGSYADAVISNKFGELQVQLKYFGYTQ